MSAERRLASEPNRARSRTKRKFLDPKTGRVSVRVLPGEHYVAESSDEVLVTILGSCVAACVRDPVSEIGGMNHFMLPHHGTGAWQQANPALRYGTHAMEGLIGDLLRRGADRQRLEIKVFGGANVTKGSVHLIGDQNCDFVRRYLQDQALGCSVFDLGGDRARRIQYYPDSGRVKRLMLRRTSDLGMLEDETAYRRRLTQVPRSGDGPARRSRS